MKTLYIIPSFLLAAAIALAAPSATATVAGDLAQLLDGPARR